MDLIEAKQKEYSTIISRHPWELARIHILKKLIYKRVSFQKNSIVVDIGCGDTFFIESIASDYPDVLFYAIDVAFTDELINSYKQKLKVNNIFLFRSIDEFSEKINGNSILIILADVIEHIEDDKKFLSELLQKKFVNNDTQFMITVPAYQSLFCSHDIFLGHYRRYTNTSLKNNLAAAGLQAINMGYFFFCLLPIRLVGVLKERIVGYDKNKMSTGLSKWNGGKVVSFIFMKLLIIDANCSLFFKSIGINFPGLSNYVICKKSVL